MTKNIPSNVQSLLEYLRMSNLVGISLEPSYHSLTLEFTYGPQGYDVIIRLFGVVHFVFSKDFEDKDEDVFTACEVNLTPIQDGGKELFSSLNYLFKRHDKEPISYPDESLYRLQIIGSVSMEVICSSYQVFQQVK